MKIYAPLKNMLDLACCNLEYVIKIRELDESPNIRFFSSPLSDFKFT